MPVSAAARCHSPSLCSTRLRLPATSIGSGPYRGWSTGTIASTSTTGADQIAALSTAHVPYGVFDPASGEISWTDPARALMTRGEQGELGELLQSMNDGRTALHRQLTDSRLEPTCLPRARLAISAHPERPLCSVLVLTPRSAALESVSLERLSARERDVADLIAAGESTKSIAARLGISEHTVRRHTEHLFAKLGVRSRAAVASMVATNTV